MKSLNRKNEPQKARNFTQFRDAETIDFEEVPASRVPAEVWKRWAVIIQAGKPAQQPALIKRLKLPSKRFLLSKVSIYTVLLLKCLTTAFLFVLQLIFIIFKTTIKAGAVCLAACFPAAVENSAQAQVQEQQQADEIEVIVKIKKLK